MKCDTPARSSRSSRDPAPIQKPSDTERTLGTFSEMTLSPESSSERTYFCTGGSYPAVQKEPLPAANAAGFRGLSACRNPRERIPTLRQLLRDELEPGAAALCLVERHVGEAKERLRVARVLGAGRSAEARADAFELLRDAPDDLARIVVRCLREQEGELVAADSKRLVATAERRLERPREQLQRIVARRMAVAVVQ